jgi:hypothetical protein
MQPVGHNTTFVSILCENGISVVPLRSAELQARMSAAGTDN